MAKGMESAKEKKHIYVWILDSESCSQYPVSESNKHMGSKTGRTLE